MAAHQLPDGKVYKQLIDDQQALARTIEANNLFVAKPSSARKGKGDQNKRKEWLQAATYEYRKCNPVLNKQLRNLESYTDGDQASTVDAINDVKNLPDVVVAAKLSSDIADRIARSRKERHFTEVENMQHELAAVAKTSEDLLRTECAGIIEKLSADNQAADYKLSAISVDEALHSLEMHELTALWSDIHAHLDQHRSWIEDFWKGVQSIEDDRLISIRRIFSTYGETLRSIAHMLPLDLQNYLDQEAQTINKVILSNRRQYVELKARLVLTEIMLDRRRFLHFNRRVRHWREKKIEICVEEFRQFISSPEVVDSDDVRNALVKIAEQQKIINAPRMGLLNDTISLLCPPTPISQPTLKGSAPVVVMQLQQQPLRPQVQNMCRELNELNAKVDSANQEASVILGAAHNAIIQRCFDRVQGINQILIGNGAATETDAERLAHQRLLPFIADLQRRFEADITLFDRLMEQQNYESVKETDTLMRFLLGAATCWDDHELELSKRERHLDERLLSVRQNHDSQIQRNELRLDRALDKLRQSGNAAVLLQNLGVALKQLDQIKDGHELFHRDTISHIKTFPDKVATTVRNYEKSLFRYMLIRRQPLPVETKEEKPKKKKGADIADGKSPKVAKPVSFSNDTAQDASPRPVSPANRPPAKLKVAKEPSTLPRLLSVPGEPAKEPAKDAGKDKSDSDDDDNAPEEVEEAQDEGDVLSDLATDSSGRTYQVIVEEVMRTRSGDMLYVLARSDDPDVANIAAAEAAAPMEGGEQSQQLISTGDQFDNPVFVTADDLAGVDMEQPHLFSSQIPRGLFRDVKKRVRANFVNHLEQWTLGMRTRAKQILQAKMEELQCEYELRLQLHAPRADVIKKDVHDVRMSELRYHQQRVDAHCAGTIERLEKIGHDFENMLMQHDQWVNDFEALVNRMTIKIEEVTKSAKLTTLQKQTQNEQERTVDLIRSSLRDMRRHLEDTANSLRIANSDLTRNFKLFSEGGNFSPEEIMEFREKIDQVGKKIDETEGSIMGEMEGIEARRLKQCSSIIVIFEDAVKYPMQDLLFLEKVSQIFTNTQCKVKAEASESNATALQLRQMIDRLERRLDAVLKPNIDKEQVTAGIVNMSLTELSDLCQQRAAYLDCLLPPPITSVAAANQQAATGQVEGQSSPDQQQQRLTAAPLGRKQQKHAPPRKTVIVNTIGGPPSSPTKQVAPSAIPPPTPTPTSTTAPPLPTVTPASLPPPAPVYKSMKEVENFASIRALLADEERKPLPPIGTTPKESDEKKKSEQGGKSTSKEEKQPDKQSAPTTGDGGDLSNRGGASTSGQAGGTAPKDKGPHGRPSLTGAAATEEKGHSKKGRPQSAGRVQSAGEGHVGIEAEQNKKKFLRSLLGNTRQARLELEKLYKTFGTTEEFPNEDFNLLGRSRIMIRAALEALLQAGEAFYRAKAIRTSAKPAVLETFEEYSEMVVKRLTSYWDQTREYHSDCVQEFRQQLCKVEDLTQSLPELVVIERFSQRSENVTEIKDNFLHDAMLLSTENERKKTANQNDLRPGLGHPQQEPILVALCHVEEQRHADFVKRLEALHAAAIDAQLKESAQFYSDLQRDGFELLTFYDGLITAANIVRGEIVQKKLPTITLIHRAQQLLLGDTKAPLDSVIATRPETSDSNEQQIGPRNWAPLIDNPDLLPSFILEKGRQLKLLASPPNVRTDHATLPQYAVIRARDNMAQKYKALVEKVVNELESLYNYMQETEEKWFEKWQRSVDGVRKLYQVQGVRPQQQQQQQQPPPSAQHPSAKS